MARGGNRKRDKRKGRRSLENPNTPLNVAYPDDDTLEAFGATRSQSGVRVGRKRALGYPAIWRAVSLITGDVAKLPLLTYKVDGENRTVDRSHYSYRLLRYKANEFLLAFHLKQILTGHALCQGNGYAYIDRAGSRPSELLILDPDRVEVVRVAGEVWYVYGDGKEAKNKIPAADILHIKGLGYDGLIGYPVLRILAESVGAAIAARDFSSRYFQNNARPGGVIEHPGKLKPEARQNLRDSWERLHRGFNNAHKVAILEEGTKYTPFTGNARESQLLESREFDAREIANIFGVPTHKLGDPSKVAYNSLGEENQSYLDDTLSRWLQLWSDECSDKLLSEKEKAAESHRIDFDYQILKRANLAAQTTYGTAAINGGWESPDEIRALFGKNPIPGKVGDAYKAVNPAPAPAPGGDPPAPARSTAGLRAVVADVARRMAGRIANHAIRSADKGAKVDQWAADLEAEHGAIVREAFGPALAACRDFGVAGGAGGVEELAGPFLAKMAECARLSWPTRAGAADAIVRAACDWVAGQLFAGAGQ
jgi:HK97 family phage portal protein